MIVMFILEVFQGLLSALFSFINLPSIPDRIVSTIDSYLDLVFNNLNFLNFFIDVDFFKICATCAIILFGVKEMYLFVMWVWRKLPFSSE